MSKILLLGLGAFAAGFLTYIGYKANKSAAARTAYTQCITKAELNEEAQIDLLEYQFSNLILVWDDYDKSKAYVDFLHEKADNVCDEAKARDQ